MTHLYRARRVCVWVSAGKQSECHAVPGGGIQTHLRQYSDALPLKTNTGMLACNSKFGILIDMEYHRFPSIFLGCQSWREEGGKTLLDIVPRY